jgi:prepilin-type N-terminal cleavage/methylation domain-containing protein
LFFDQVSFKNPGGDGSDMMRSKTRRDGFTLVELLVVISITAVLIAVLLPAITEARKNAQSAVCKARERQIGIAFYNYNVNFQQYYPYASPYWTSDYGIQGTAGEQAWSFKINDYLGGYKLTDTPKQLICPSNPWVVPAAGTSRVSTAATYGMGPTFPSTGTATRGTAITTDMIKEQQLKAPSRILLLGETPLGVAQEYGRTFSEGMALDPRNFRTDNATYFAQAPVGMWYGQEFSAPPAGTNPIARVNHKVGWNSLMADGSVQYHSKARLQTLANQATGLVAQSDGYMFWRGR